MPPTGLLGPPPDPGRAAFRDSHGSTRGHRAELQAGLGSQGHRRPDRLLDPDATAIADGGGLATTFLHPIEGGEQIAHAWVEIANRIPGTMTFLERTVNGQPGLVAQQDGITVTVYAFEIAGDRIKHIWVVRNPEKLGRWSMG